MSVLRISLFGSVQVSHSDRRINVGKFTYTVLALLAYLLVERHRLHPREVLAGLFWGDHEADRARKCLNTTLWRLRQALEPSDIPSGTYLIANQQGDVGFNLESQYWLDIQVFEEKLRTILVVPPYTVNEQQLREAEEAIALYSGELLEGFYDDWALREREQMRRLYLRGLAHLMDCYKHRRIFHKSLEYGQMILDEDPLREEIHRELMVLYWESGQRSLGLRQFEICRTALSEELGAPPMAETISLYQQLLSDLSPSSPILNPDRSSDIQRAVTLLSHACLSFAAAQDELQQVLHFVQTLMQNKA